MRLLLQYSGNRKQAVRVASAAFAAILALGAGTSAWAQSFPNHFDPTSRDSIAEVEQVPAIRFLTTPDFPPLNYRAANGELVGFHVDLARAICEIAEAACTIQAWPWEQAPDALLDNQGDALIAGLAITPETGMRFDFSQIYMMFPGRFVVQNADRNAFDPRALEGRVISVRGGSGHDLFATRYLEGAQLARFETELEALQALEEGGVYAYFGDAMRASFWLNENPDCCAFTPETYFRSDLFGEGLAIAFPAGQNLVRRTVNAALVQLKREGMLDELYLRWFPVGFY